MLKKERTCLTYAVPGGNRLSYPLSYNQKSDFYPGFTNIISAAGKLIWKYGTVFMENHSKTI